MVKKFLKIAGVKTQAEFYKKYPTEAAFFRAHPEAQQMVKAADGGAFVPSYGDTMLPQAMYGMGMAYGGSYKDGGSPLYSTQGQTLRNFNNTLASSGGFGNQIILPQVGPNNSGNASRMPAGLPNLGRGITIPRYFDEGGMAAPQQPGMEQQAPEQGGGEDQQMQQVIQAVVEMLQQGMPPEEVIKKLVEMGIPQEQAMQLVQAIMQKMQEAGQQQQGPAEEQMEGQQEPPAQEVAEGQPGMRMGGEPCYNCGGMYAYGGPSKNNSTYYQGMSYAGGGPFIPEYADQAYGTYASGGEAQASQLMQKVAEMIQQGIQPDIILQQLIQAKIPKKDAVKLVKAVVAQMQQQMSKQQMGMGQAPMAAYGGPYMELSSKGNSTNYKKGGEYDMTHEQVQDLINKGYKIQYL